MQSDELLNYVPKDRIITVNEVIGANAAMYMHIILFASSMLVLYVLYTNFILGSKYDFMAKYKIDIHELAILPAMVVWGISVAYSLR